MRTDAANLQRCIRLFDEFPATVIGKTLKFAMRETMANEIAPV
jgi:hypothetical protein